MVALPEKGREESPGSTGQGALRNHPGESPQGEESATETIPLRYKIGVRVKWCGKSTPPEYKEGKPHPEQG